MSHRTWSSCSTLRTLGRTHDAGSVCSFYNDVTSIALARWSYSARWAGVSNNLRYWGARWGLDAPQTPCARCWGGGATAPRSFAGEAGASPAPIRPGGSRPLNFLRFRGLSLPRSLGRPPVLMGLATQAPSSHISPWPINCFRGSSGHFKNLHEKHCRMVLSRHP